MNTMTHKPKYIPIDWKPRLIACGEGLFSLYLVANQGWYTLLFEYRIWAHSITSLNDPINDFLVMFFHAWLVGGFIGWAIIALRSAITGYAPTAGIITYREFLARYPASTSGDVKVTEESSTNPVALVDSRSLEDCFDACYVEDTVSKEASHTVIMASQEKAYSVYDVDELPSEDAKREQDIEQTIHTRALIVYPVRFEERDVSEEQSARDVDEIRKVLYFLVSFFKELIVSVVLSFGSIIKRCQVNLDNRLKSFVGFLATRVKGTRLEQNDFEDRVFHSVEDGSLHQAKYELKRKINMAIKELDPEHPEIDVLELRSRKKRSTYYNALSKDWYPFLPSELELLAYHSLVRDIQADPAHTLNIPLEKWRRLYQKVISTYNEKGFLGEHLENDEDHRWCWAEAPFLHIRDDQLLFIFFCAQLEQKAGQQATDPLTQRECLEQEAWLWREGIFTAMTYHPDLKRGKNALRHYLEVCDFLGWQESAKNAVDQYNQLSVSLGNALK